MDVGKRTALLVRGTSQKAPDIDGKMGACDRCALEVFIPAEALVSVQTLKEKEPHKELEIEILCSECADTRSGCPSNSFQMKQASTLLLQQMASALGQFLNVHHNFSALLEVKNVISTVLVTHLAAVRHRGGMVDEPFFENLKKDLIEMTNLKYEQMKKQDLH